MRASFVVNSLTFSRVPLAIAFIVFFQPKTSLLVIAGAILIVANITDILDGYLARRFSINSTHGLHWDSLADKSIYIAASIAMTTHEILSPLVCWAVIFRDVAMYVYRLVHVGQIENLHTTKLYSRIHGLFVYAMILTGFLNMMSIIDHGVADYVLLTNVLGLVGVGFGVYSAVAFSIMDKK